MAADARVGRVLIDDSVWSRLSRDANVASAMRLLVADAAQVMVCPPTALEFGFSTRSGADHTRLVAQMDRFVDCPVAPTSAQVLALQNALWTRGLLRAAGAMDILVAAYAIENDATLIHYDRDFEHIATVSDLRQRWVVPPGTV